MDTVSIRIDDEVYKRALKKKRKYVSVTTHLSLLIEEALDMLDTMKRPPGRYSYSSNSSSFEELEKESMREKGRETFLTPEWQLAEHFTCHDPEKHKAFLKEQKKVSQKLPTAFIQFWTTYQTAPRKANQSRKKAFEAWKEALKVEKSDRLIEAAKRAVLDQTNKMQHEEWFEPLPDCHRWLRDEKYVVLLEAHTPAKAKQIIPGVTCL
jgi:transketolase